MIKIPFNEFVETLDIDKDRIEPLKALMQTAIEDQKLRDVWKSLDKTLKQPASEIGVA